MIRTSCVLLRLLPKAHKRRIVLRRAPALHMLARLLWQCCNQYVVLLHTRQNAAAANSRNTGFIDAVSASQRYMGTSAAQMVVSCKCVLQEGSLCRTIASAFCCSRSFITACTLRSAQAILCFVACSASSVNGTGSTEFMELPACAWTAIA